jgi:hypothetical protein
MKIISTEKLPIKLCKCGCQREISLTDKYGRNHDFISGHNGKKYEDPTQYKREWNHRNRQSRYESKVERGHRLKVKMIGLMGGKCTNPVCNLEYNGKNACVFQAHHIDPSKKLFVINTRTLINYSWNKILKEIAKCRLFCANCHFIEENEEY